MYYGVCTSGVHTTTYLGGVCTMEQYPEMATQKEKRCCSLHEA